MPAQLRVFTASDWITDEDDDGRHPVLLDQLANGRWRAARRTWYRDHGINVLELLRARHNAPHVEGDADA